MEVLLSVEVLLSTGVTLSRVGAAPQSGRRVLQRPETPAQEGAVSVEVLFSIEVLMSRGVTLSRSVTIIRVVDVSRTFTLSRDFTLSGGVTHSRGVVLLVEILFFPVELQHLVEVLFTVEQLLFAVICVEVIVHNKHSQ